MYEYHQQSLEEEKQNLLVTANVTTNTDKFKDSIDNEMAKK